MPQRCGGIHKVRHHLNDGNQIERPGRAIVFKRAALYLHPVLRARKLGHLRVRFHAYALPAFIVKAFQDKSRRGAHVEHAPRLRMSLDKLAVGAPAPAKEFALSGVVFIARRATGKVVVAVGGSHMFGASGRHDRGLMTTTSAGRNGVAVDLEVRFQHPVTKWAGIHLLRQPKYTGGLGNLTGPFFVIDPEVTWY